MTDTPSTPDIHLPQPLLGHPRLLASAEDWPRLRRQIRSDPASSRIFTSLQKKAEHFLGQPLLERKMTGRRLLSVSRHALERIATLAMVARVGGDKQLARRGIDEMVNVAGFSDWNPSHYLDVAEMSLALAIGYDWLNDDLSSEEGNLMATALLEKGINPSFSEPEQGFIRANNNWNQVCHSGLSAAAIAIADRHPETALAVLKRAVENLPHSAGAYVPDGAYMEGPMYWNYGTLFHAVLADALQRFLGTTCGVDAYPGFAASAEYIAQMTTPTGFFYNYADCRLDRHMLVPLFWFARQFRRPDWLSADLDEVGTYMDQYDDNKFDDSNYRLLSLALLWRDPALDAKAGAKPRLHWLGKGLMPVAAHRSSFKDTQALYAAIKGGCPAHNHAHMDSGSFMIQSGGVVWATDLGMQSYESLESINVNLWDRSENGTRWTIFRLGPEGHNILRFNGAPQLLSGNGQFIRFQGEGPTPHSVLDLGSLYQDQVKSVHRGLMFVGNRAVLLQDEWAAGDHAVEVGWQWLTRAHVTLGKGFIQLCQEGKTMNLQILDSPDARVESVDTAALQKPFDAANPGLKRITVRLRTEAGQKGRLRIFVTPESTAALAPPLLRVLADWS